MSTWNSADEAGAALKRAGYLADGVIAQVVFLADRLDKPILTEGPAGVGKTALALALAGAITPSPCRSSGCLQSGSSLRYGDDLADVARVTCRPALPSCSWRTCLRPTHRVRGSYLP